MTRKNKKKLCRKQGSYKTKGLACNAASRVPETPGGQVPIRVYWCSQHKAWHFTSKQRMQRKK